MLFEVIGDGNTRASLAHWEHYIFGALCRQPLDDQSLCLACVLRGNAHTRDETLQMQSLSISEQTLSKFVGVISLKKLKTKRQQRSCLIHHSRSDVQIDVHGAHRGSDRLEISSVQLKAASDITLPLTREKRADIERILEVGFHPYHDVQCLYI